MTFGRITIRHMKTSDGYVVALNIPGCHTQFRTARIKRLGTNWAKDRIRAWAEKARAEDVVRVAFPDKSDAELARMFGVNPSTTLRWRSGSRGMEGPTRKLVPHLMGL